MPRYNVKVRSRSEGIKNIIVQSKDQKEAARIGSRYGQVLSTTKKIGFDFSQGMTVSERYTWMQRMSSMLGSKVPISEALRIMSVSFGGRIKIASNSMADKLDVGIDLPSAMEQDSKNFPLMTTALVKAGTSTGETWRALKDAADFEYKLEKSNKASLSQVRNAIGMFLLAGLIMVATTQYFGPMVMDNPIFKTKNVDVEWARTLGDVVTLIMVILMGLFIAFWLLGFVGRRIMPDLSDAFILKVPFYKDLILARNNHVTLYKLSLLLKAGVYVEEALRLSADGSQRGALKTDLLKAAHAVRRGVRDWANSMSILHPTDKAALTMSADREDVSRTLNMLAQQYADLYIQRIETLAPVLGSIAAVFMTLSGGIMFAQMILPMLQFAAFYN